MVEKAIEAGATTVNIPDTVGYAVPEPLRRDHPPPEEERPRHRQVRAVSVHCHNDLGLAVANSLAALREGARQVECTINGIGERAGNTVARRSRDGAADPAATSTGLTTGINTRRLYPISRMLSHITGMQVQRNKAIVGQNAFAHEAGIHQDGMLKERSTYEIMKPEDVGIPRTDLVLGKHSGRHALQQRVTRPGLPPRPTSNCNRVFEEFKRLADKKKEIYDADIEALAENQLQAGTGNLWTLVGFTSTAGTGSQTSAAVDAEAPGRHGPPRRGDRQRPDRRAVQGDQPRSPASEVKVVDYRVRSVTQDMDALGEARSRSSTTASGRGRAVSVDVVEASALAYLEVVNRVASRQVRDRLKPTDHVPTEVVPAT